MKPCNFLPAISGGLCSQSNAPFTRYGFVRTEDLPYGRSSVTLLSHATDSSVRRIYRTADRPYGDNSYPFHTRPSPHSFLIVLWWTNKLYYEAKSSYCIMVTPPSKEDKKEKLD
ncbi:hypothetical protein QE152_g37309 [Popillia japonica]|uniref:Uncharacterized protein n=1 Tax=Popillia japonica TaxID=7064 RepID=A0AAW1IAM4_POPJA